MKTSIVLSSISLWDSGKMSYGEPLGLAVIVGRGGFEPP